MKITVKAKVIDDSKNKLGKIESEFQNYQAYLQSGCTAIVNLYSATKQQAQRALKKIKQPNSKKQYPVILRRDLVDIQKDIKFESVYWIRIPVYPNSINIRIQTSCKYDLSEYSIRESKMLKIENEWYIFITIEKQDESIIPADNVLAVDLGCKNIAVTVNTVNTKPNFYGAAVRGIRGFYFNLRRKLGEKKAADKKSLKNIEFLQVNHELHKISKTIVEETKTTNAIIILGKLKGIRKNIKRSRRMRRLINNFPYYRLVQYIKYKAAWRNIRALEISEVDTSNTCFNCRAKDKKARKHKDCSNVVIAALEQMLIIMEQ
jgi:putative transposase